MKKLLNWLLFWKKAPEQMIEEQETPEIHQRESLMRIVIERHPNPNCTTYHLNRRLSESPSGIAFEYNGGNVRPGGLLSSTREELPVEPFVQSVAERIYAVSGVTDDVMVGGSGVRVGAYEIRVGKGRAFSDIEIETGVIAAIADSFGLNVEDIDVTVQSERHMLGRNRIMEDSLFD